MKHPCMYITIIFQNHAPFKSESENNLSYKDTVHTIHSTP